jgi:uridine kinase
VVLIKDERQGIHTILRDISTPMPDFIFFANRLSTLVIEHALSLLPYQDSPITTRTQIPYTGQELAIPSGNLCGVSILRSGAPLEQGLRRAVRDVPIGSILIQSDTTTGEPLLFHLSLPSCLTKSTLSAQNSYVLLMDSQIGTGAAALMACRTLLDHGVKEENILFCALLVSRWGGIWAIRNAFPRVRVACSAVDDEMEARVEDGKKVSTSSLASYRRKILMRWEKVFAILPGMGSFGDRYYGA